MKTHLIYTSIIFALVLALIYIWPRRVSAAPGYVSAQTNYVELTNSIPTNSLVRKGDTLEQKIIIPTPYYGNITYTNSYLIPEKNNRIVLSLSYFYPGLLDAELSYQYKRFIIGGSVGYDAITRNPTFGLRAGVEVFSW